MAMDKGGGGVRDEGDLLSGGPSVGAGDGDSGSGGVVAPGEVRTAPAQLAARIGELERRLADAQRELQAGALERRIDAALATHGVIDAEVGRVLVTSELEQRPELDVEEAVASLKSRKPFLFGERGAGLSSGAAYAPGGQGMGEEEALASIRQAASSTGDRGELLRYLRARRTS
ncbi:MAG: hypothetical protein Tsb0013_24970 [Phycisphaerales bacterium]